MSRFSWQTVGELCVCLTTLIGRKQELSVLFTLPSLRSRVNFYHSLGGFGRSVITPLAMAWSLGFIFQCRDGLWLITPFSAVLESPRWAQSCFPSDLVLAQIQEGCQEGNVWIESLDEGVPNLLWCVSLSWSHVITGMQAIICHFPLSVR